MIRSFEYHPSTDQLLEVLGLFGFKISKEKYPLAVLRFEVITPDSFMWRLLVKDAVYYLYAEDYVSGLEHIKNVFNSYLDTDQWDLVKTSKVKEFESSTPVKGASVYKGPKNAEEMMVYAVDSGYDFVFLAKSKEDPDEAQFSDHAPRGFDNNLIK